MPSGSPHVVVLGGGFAGLNATRELARHAVNVTLIDQHNFHTFSPLLDQVATAGLEPADVAYPLRTVFRRWPTVRVVHHAVTTLDAAAKTVTLENNEIVNYDHAVITSGCAATFYDIPGAREYAAPLYTLDDARQLRNRLLRAIETLDRDGASLSVAVIGGGPTGVETAGAIAELVDVSLRRDGIRAQREQISITVVDQAERLLLAFPDRIDSYARRVLASRGIDTILQKAVREVHADHLEFTDGSTMPSSVVVWAGGLTARTSLELVGVPRLANGRIDVDRDLAVRSIPGLWAAGDVAAIPDGRSAGFCPQLAPVAIQSGRHVGRQIVASLTGAPTTPFRYRDKGIMATIGRRAAVTKLPNGSTVTGTVGWIAWLVLHLFYLIGFRNRLRVVLNWTWRYFEWPSGPRLIVGEETIRE